MTQKRKVDDLKKVSQNNFPPVVNFLDSLLHEELLPITDPAWKSPLDGTCATTRPRTIADIWKAHRATYTPRVAGESRERDQPARAAVDPPTLATVTNQPTQLSDGSPADPDRIVRILRERGKYYMVQYGNSQRLGDTRREGSTGWIRTRRMSTWCGRGAMTTEAAADGAGGGG